SPSAPSPTRRSSTWRPASSSISPSATAACVATSPPRGRARSSRSSIAKRRNDSSNPQHCPARRDMPTMAEIFIAESGVHRTSAQAPSLAFLAEPSLTFPAVFGRRMAEQPEAIAFYDVPWGASGLSEPRPMTYRHLGACAARAATLLGDAGVSRGDRVLLCVESRETFFAFFLGAEALGAVPVPLPAASEARLPAAFR